MTNTCATCQRPMADTAVTCHHCTDRAYRDLHDLADAVPAARDVAAGQTSRGPTSGGGHPGSRIPLDLTAAHRLHVVQNEINGWARAVADDRGDAHPVGLIAGARYLAGQLNWVRKQHWADEAYRDFRAAAVIVRSIAAGPAERRWLGQCGADLEGDERCQSDLHARLGATTAVCRACGARHRVDERRAFLDGQTRDQAYTARQISQAYPQIPEGTIRSWANRGEIQPELVPLPDGIEGPLDVHRDPAGRPRPRYVLGDVQDLHARKLAARAAREARRAQMATPT